MKENKRIIHIAEHKPTGAKVPMVIAKVNDKNMIEDYKEYLEHRRGFTLLMLENRWDMCRDDTLDLLQKYQVPAHINHQEIKKLRPDQLPVEAAIFFEEYIFGIEKKEKLSHNKLKSKTLESIRSH